MLEDAEKLPPRPDLRVQGSRSRTYAVAHRYWHWLGSVLHLTLGGRLVFTAVGLVGITGGLVQAFNFAPGADSAGGVFIVIVAWALAVVVGLDGLYRATRVGIGRLTGKPSPR